MNEERIPVIQLVDGFATDEQSGGAAQFGIQLARHLQRDRYAAFVCGLWRYHTPSERRWRERLHDEGIPTAILVETPGRIGTDMIRAAAFFLHIIDRIRPRVINSHFERGDLLGLFGKLARPAGPRIVRTMHTDQQWQTRPWLGKALNIAAFPWLFDGEVAISRATQDVLDRRVAARLRGRRSALLYNGVSGTLLERLAADCASRATPASHAPRLAIVGRLERQKGHSDLLRAMVDLLRRLPEAELWIVGAGSLQDSLRALAAELEIAHAVRFLGQRNDVPDILLDVDLLVSASLWEGFPTVILEAMAARVPVVATDVSGSRELVRSGETGQLVPVGRPDLLAQAILWMLDNPALAHRMAEHAWRQVQNYSLEQIAASYDRLYRSLLGEQT